VQGKIMKKKIKIAIWVLLALVIAVILSFIVLGQISKSGIAPGLTDGKLAPCESKPNCVSSEDKSDARHYLEPILISKAISENLMNTIKKEIGHMGGSIQNANSTYFSATFKSDLFGFIDDVEIRIDWEASVINVRSGSRVGYSDRGVNKTRIEELRRRLKKY
jgi:uncharacterized protein (DUF1499 family)